MPAVDHEWWSAVFGEEAEEGEYDEGFVVAKVDDRLGSVIGGRGCLACGLSRHGGVGSCCWESSWESSQLYIAIKIVKRIGGD